MCNLSGVIDVTRGCVCARFALLPWGFGMVYSLTFAPVVSVAVMALVCSTSLR